MGRQGKMVNYSHMLVVALAVTSLVLLVKYRNLTLQFSNESAQHRIYKKSLEDDLGKEAERYHQLNTEMNLRIEENKALDDKIKNIKNELSNTVNALQESNNRIEALNLEKQTQFEELGKVTDEKADMNIHMNSLQEQLSNAEDELGKVRAMADDNSLTLKDAHEKQEKLLSENTKLTQQIASFQDLQAENGNLKKQLQDALNEAKTAKGRVAELEDQVAQKLEAQVAQKQGGPDDQQKDKAEEKDNGQDNDAANGDIQKEEEQSKMKVEEENKKVEEENEKKVEEENKKKVEEENKKEVEEVNKDKADEDDIAVYSIQDEDEKKKEVAKELNSNDNAEVEGGGEVIDDPNDQAKVGPNPAANVLMDGEGRELEMHEDDDAGKDLKDNIQEEGKADNSLGVQESNVGVAIGDDGDPQAPKAFEEGDGMGGSFARRSQSGGLSWQGGSTDEEGI